VEGDAEVAFVRLPIDRDGLNVIRLYEEVPFVVAPAEHPLSVYETVSLADLEGEVVRTEPIADAIDLVVAGVGILLVPQSIARMHTRRDLVMRPVTDAPVNEIAVAWLADRTTADVEEFIGIVRGRTAASSRGNPQPNQQHKGKQHQPVKPARRKKTR
jgi:DNA-binding transcriptional LysR family regulator